MTLSVTPTYALGEAINKPVYKSKTNEVTKIALTFDDGPHPKKTKEILEILKKYDVKATFFVIGVNVKNYPYVIKEIIDDGHEVGNHTYSHKKLKGVNKEKITEELKRTDEEIITQNGNKTNLIRPPCGEYDDTLIEVAIENNCKIVLWNVDTKDWAHSPKETIIDKVLSNVKGGDIILFHDYLSGKNNTVEALDELVPLLQEKGYEFVTIGELLQN
jgi:polysaccharide deacetylase family sporulation protein PdaB